MIELPFLRVAVEALQMDQVCKKIEHIRDITGWWLPVGLKLYHDSRLAIFIGSHYRRLTILESWICQSRIILSNFLRHLRRLSSTLVDMADPTVVLVEGQAHHASFLARRSPCSH